MTDQETILARRRELEDLAAVLGSPEGRRFIWRFLSEARIFSPCYTGNSETFYREGRREFALKYFNDVMEACPDLYTVMQKENTRKEEKHVGD